MRKGVAYPEHRTPVAEAVKGQRATSSRHPLLRGKPKNVWHPECAGLVRGYPKTQEAFNSLQDRMRRVHGNRTWPQPTRKGVPDGFGGRLKEVIAIRARAAEEAKGIIETMEAQGIIDNTGLEQSEADMANEALQFAVATMRAKDDAGKATYTIRDRHAAATLILAYTKQKPATKTDLRVAAAEDFLDAIMAPRPTE